MENKNFYKSVSWRANDAEYELKLWKDPYDLLRYDILKNGRHLASGNANPPNETEEELIERIKGLSHHGHYTF